MEIPAVPPQDILEYEIAIPEELYEYEIIKLTLQPLLENALYHGIKNKRGGGHIRVSGALCQDVMIFKVQDDGIGMDGARLAQVCAMLRDGEQEPEQEETGGFGLFNVNQRIQLNYGREYGLKIQSTYGQGTERSGDQARAEGKSKRNAIFEKNYTLEEKYINSERAVYNLVKNYTISKASRYFLTVRKLLWYMVMT